MKKRKIMQGIKKMNENKKTAVAYIRTATIEQNHINGGESAIRQMNAMKDKAKKQNTQIIADFADLGVPRANKVRPGYNEMLDYLARNKVDSVYMTRMDRLSIIPEEAIDMVQPIEDTGAQLVFTDEDRALIKEAFKV